MGALFRPGIVVLNKKYFPQDPSSAAQVGASSFALSVLRVLHDAHILCGVVLYERNEKIEKPGLNTDSLLYDEIPVVTLSFNFRMPQLSIAFALGKAYIQILYDTHQKLSPIIYYQTDSILHFHPPGFQFCVTNHGPFVSDFTQSFSRPLAQIAFGGDANKIDILERQQNLGIDRLRKDRLGSVLAHSGLQQRFLEKQGLDKPRFEKLRPPIGVPHCKDFSILPLNIREFVSGAEILFFTAVARLDYFKNVSLLIQSGLQLASRGLPVKILILGDPDNDDARRHDLLCLVPKNQRRHFLVLPRLPKNLLYALFSAVRNNGIFFCPSRYETLGITPLETAASGVTTLITDSSKVEASMYLPECCRVPPKTERIVAKVQMIYSEGIHKWAEMVGEHVRPDTSLDAFREDLIEAWSRLSSSGSH